MRPRLLALALVLSLSGTGYVLAHPGDGQPPPGPAVTNLWAAPVVPTTVVAPPVTVSPPRRLERASRGAVRPRPVVAVYADVDGMPWLLRRIGGCESAGAPAAPINWVAQNRHSTASGGFQILDSTWRGWQSSYGGGGFVDADGTLHVYARAMEAPPEYQLRVARAAFERQGTAPWRASQGCWG